jgi:hypothetical protein
MITSDIAPIINFYPWLEHNEDFEVWNTLDLIFTHFTLNDIRHSLWEMYEAALLDNSLNISPKDRSDLLFFFVNLNDLATAAYVICEREILEN